jgi:hypothetical protein
MTVSRPPEGGAQSPTTKHPLSKGQMYAVGSIACGVLASFIFPYILGFAGILIGIVALKEKYKMGVIGILLSAAVISIAFLT